MRSTPWQPLITGRLFFLHILSYKYINQGRNLQGICWSIYIITFSGIVLKAFIRCTLIFFLQIHLEVHFLLSLKIDDFKEPLRVIARVYAWREGKSFFLQLMKVPVFAIYILRGFDCIRNHRGLPQEQSRNRTFRGERRLFCLDWDCWRSGKEHVNNQWKETPFLQWLSPNTQYQKKLQQGKNFS